MQLLQTSRSSLSQSNRKNTTSLRACACASFVGFYSLRTYTYIGTPRMASCHPPTISTGIIYCVFLCPESSTQLQNQQRPTFAESEKYLPQVLGTFIRT
jgi:hypothetical protein